MDTINNETINKNADVPKPGLVQLTDVVAKALSGVWRIWKPLYWKKRQRWSKP